MSTTGRPAASRARACSTASSSSSTVSQIQPVDWRSPSSLAIRRL
ncbi:hypothetical protein V2I01_12160 [Micromonospora sp. BRA006-A]|nr:hypothetical protein [Micromonospora sp. BRA006-A]